MKKLIFLSLFITPIHALTDWVASKDGAEKLAKWLGSDSQYKNDIQQLHDEIIAQHTPILKEEHALIKELSPHIGWFSVYTDEKKEALKQDPKTKEFLCNFYTLNSQALGIQFCHQCLTKKENPTSQDLQTCYEKWLESDDREWALDNAKKIEKMLNYKRELRHAFHQGNHILEERLQKIIQENSKNQ